MKTLTSTLTICFLFLMHCKNNKHFNPKIELTNYHIENGFNLKVIASEPYIEAPVAIDFDNTGRMWVVEMKGYMRNLNGDNDQLPNGTISILEDLDRDGIIDHAKVFLDSLVLPRAIAHVYGGLLYAEPPNLWFVDIENDKPINKVLVDANYAVGGNVEHQPNGLLMHIDNWIYNAKSKYRYQKTNGVWIKDSTTFRGQWGITKDGFGRLYYNTNSTQIMGDYVLPNSLFKNPFYKPFYAVDKSLTDNQSVYPLHPTAVNRGYLKGVLNKDSLLINTTSACAPVIYQGNQYPTEFFQNAFVCLPEINAIKRNVLSFYPDSVAAKQAYNTKEFIASTDEGFRPVNLINAPDGTLYIVDMHRGIIQDKTYLTPYLKAKYADKKLDTVIGMGRIIKIEPAIATTLKSFHLNTLTTPKIVELLTSENVWFRDKAQQLLLLKADKTAVPLLKTMLQSSDPVISKIHALHTLNGLHALDIETLKNCISANNESSLIAHALNLLSHFAQPEHLNSMQAIYQVVRAKQNPEIDLYFLTALTHWTPLAPDYFYPILFSFSNSYTLKPIYQEAVMNALAGVENDYLKKVNLSKSSPILIKMLQSTLAQKKTKAIQIKKLSVALEQSKLEGAKVFNTVCAACHGMQGKGIENLAPPFENSDFINGHPKTLALVILHGLSGPIHINGKLYNFNATMPGLNSNSEYDDEAIKNIVTYLQLTFGKDNLKHLNVNDIQDLRKITPKNGTFTEAELKQLH